MQFIPELLIAGAMMVVGTIGQQIPSSVPGTAAPVTASVRFTNNLTSSATLKAGSEVLFSDVASTTTTEWGIVTDSVVTFTVTTTGEGGKTATASETMAEGVQYTVTADPGTDGTPMLKVKRETTMLPPDSTTAQ